MWTLTGVEVWTRLKPESDLSESGFVRVHTSTPVSVHTGQSPALSLSVLESVLNGISAL